LTRKSTSLLLSLLAAVPFSAAWAVATAPHSATVADAATKKKHTPTPVPKKKVKKKVKATATPVKKKATTKKKKKTATPTPRPKPTATAVPKPTDTPQPSGSNGTFDGPTVQSRYGPVQVTLVVQNGKITDVKVSNQPDTARSIQIQGQAVPMLKQETLQAQSANIHMISGATITSRAFEQSLQTAANKANL